MSKYGGTKSQDGGEGWVELYGNGVNWPEVSFSVGYCS
jgi:hypothetical protein